MKKLLLCLTFISIAAMVFAQTGQSKIIMKNGDVVTGKILEMKPNEYVKVEALGTVLTIQYSEIKSIVLDANSEPDQESGDLSGLSKQPKEEKVLKKLYFESIVEAAVGIGIGKVYNLPFTMDATILNNNVYSGLYTANGVGYDGRFFLGIGLGFNGNSEGQSYAIPYTLDARFRLWRDKKFSPMAMGFVGAEYLEGGLGTFTFAEGLGLSIRLKERFALHALLSHTFTRFMPNLSLENGPIEAALGNSYVNYFGLRVGVSFKM